MISEYRLCCLKDTLLRNRNVSITGTSEYLRFLEEVHLLQLCYKLTVQNVPRKCVNPDSIALALTSIIAMDLTGRETHSL